MPFSPADAASLETLTPMLASLDAAETWKQHTARAYPVASLYAELQFELEGIGADYRVVAVRHDGERLKLSDQALRAISDAIHMDRALDGQATFEMGAA